MRLCLLIFSGWVFSCQLLSAREFNYDFEFQVIHWTQKKLDQLGRVRGGEARVLRLPLELKYASEDGMKQFYCMEDTLSELQVYQSDEPLVIFQSKQAYSGSSDESQEKMAFARPKISEGQGRWLILLVERPDQKVRSVVYDISRSVLKKDSMRLVNLTPLPLRLDVGGQKIEVESSSARDLSTSFYKTRSLKIRAAQFHEPSERWKLKLSRQVSKVGPIRKIAFFYQTNFLRAGQLDSLIVDLDVKPAEVDLKELRLLREEELRGY
ncbi:MAG: hypothetical protein AAGC74_00035 [Verrucomicrobiota bacterium]